MDMVLVPPADPADYPLFRGQTALMAAALRLVSRDGYLWYSVQTTSEEKVLHALRKLHERHMILMDPRARIYRRKAGLPLAQVLLGPEPRGGRWPLILLSDQKLPGENMAGRTGYPSDGWPGGRKRGFPLTSSGGTKEGGGPGTWWRTSTGSSWRKPSTTPSRATGPAWWGT